MNSNFRIRLCSDLDYEEMVADICYNNFTVAIITQDKGTENMEIKIFSPEQESFWDFPLNEFIEAIQLAKKRLTEFREEPN